MSNFFLVETIIYWSSVSLVSLGPFSRPIAYTETLRYMVRGHKTRVASTVPAQTTNLSNTVACADMTNDNVDRILEDCSYYDQAARHLLCQISIVRIVGES